MAYPAPCQTYKMELFAKKIENLWVSWIFAEELSSRRHVNTRVSLITSGCIYHYYTLGEKNKLKWRYIRWSYDVIYHLSLRFPTVISKNCFYLFFFSSSGKYQFRHLVGCHATVISSLLKSILHALSFANLLRQTKSLKWLNVDSIFDIDFFDVRFIYNYDLQAQNFLSNELPRIY